MKVLKLAALQLIFASLLFAQSEPVITQKIGGTLQNYFSYQQCDSNSISGFGVRRARLRYYASVDEKFKAFFQVDLAGNGLSGKLMDARIEYHFSSQFNVKVGRFIGAGMRGGGLTFHYYIDIVERSFSAIRWGAATVGSDYRDFGLQAEGKFSDFTGRVFLHNGNGASNITSKSGEMASSDLNGTAVTGQIILTPRKIHGLEIGGHYGIGNKAANGLDSYSTYVYYEPGPYRLKAELVRFNLNSSSHQNGALGYYLFGAYLVHPQVELLGRFERSQPGDANYAAMNLYTIGAAYRQYSGKLYNKLTGAFVFSSERNPHLDEKTFYLMWQVYF